MNIYRTIGKAVIICTTVAATASWAHTAWLEPDSKGAHHYQVRFGGHAGKLEPLEPEKVKSIAVYNAAGDRLDFSRADAQAEIGLVLPAEAAWVAMHYDNGIWSKNPMGESINRPLGQVPGASNGTRAVKYHKTILQWNNALTQPLGQAMEVVPLEGRQPVAGKPFKVKVLIDGKPAEGVALGRGEKGELATTNARGIAGFVPESGFNKLWAGHRMPVQKKDYTEMSYEYLLGFTAADQ